MPCDLYFQQLFHHLLSQDLIVLAETSHATIIISIAWSVVYIYLWFWEDICWCTFFYYWHLQLVSISWADIIRPNSKIFSLCFVMTLVTHFDTCREKYYSDNVILKWAGVALDWTGKLLYDCTNAVSSFLFSQVLHKGTILKILLLQGTSNFLFPNPIG